MSYTHFTLEERKYLQELLAKGVSMRKIAAILGRAPSTISREIKRNRAKYKPHRKPDNQYWYNHWHAHNLYIRRRREQNHAALQPGMDAWNFVIDGLRKFWSPESICGRWSMLFPERKRLSFSTIYRYIKRKKFPNISRKTHLRRRGKRALSRNSNYNTIHPDRIIPQWPDEIKNRSRIGDWEGDTVYGGVGKGLLITLVDRKTRFVRIGLLQNRKADETARMIQLLLDGLPVNSISLDNGAEFADFHQIEQKLHTLVYFAEPHKPWQRGTNENTNDLIRFFFPKGFDFRAVTDQDIRYVEMLLNCRPRKCLGWKSPAEVFFHSSVALT